MKAGNGFPGFPSFVIPRKQESPGFLCCGIPAFEGVDKWLFSVMPAKAGIHNHLKRLDSRFHGNDDRGEIPNKSTPCLSRE